MSFGQTKMREISARVGESHLISDHRGADWLVIASKDGGLRIRGGTMNHKGSVSEFSKSEIGEVPSSHRPWAKKLLKNYGAKSEKDAELEAELKAELEAEHHVSANA